MGREKHLGNGIEERKVAVAGNTKNPRLGIPESEGLMKPEAPFVVGTPANRYRMTIEGRNNMSELCRKLTSKSSEDRMWAAQSLQKILNRDGHLCAYLREQGGSVAMSFQNALDKAFSVGDKELNKVLKNIRKTVYTRPQPRHCIMISVEDLETARKKAEAEEKHLTYKDALKKVAANPSLAIDEEVKAALFSGSPSLQAEMENQLLLSVGGSETLASELAERELERLEKGGLTEIQKMLRGK